MDNTQGEQGLAKDPMNIGPRSQGYKEEAESRALSWMNPITWNQMAIVAKAFMDSGAIPTGIKNAPQMMMILQAGREVGMGPIESLGAFYFVNGRLSMYGDRVISQVMKAGHIVEWGECNDEKATVKITRIDTGKSMEETYTLEQAKKSGLVKQGNPWERFPGRMLKYRVFSNVAHYIVPDALNGVMIEGEAESIPPEDAEKKDAGTKQPPAKSAEVVAPATHKPLTEALKPEEPKGEKAEGEEQPK